MYNIVWHPWINGLDNILGRYFWFPSMNNEIMEHVKCFNYNQYDKYNTKYTVNPPPKNVIHLHPWEEVALDLIEHWRTRLNHFQRTFLALKCVDTQ